VRGERLGSLVAVLALATGLAAGPAEAGPAGAGLPGADSAPAPTPGQIAAANSAVGHRAAEVTAVERQIAITQRRLGVLNTTAELTIESFDLAQVRLAQASTQAVAAETVAAAAGVQLADAQTAVDRYAASAYMSIGTGSALGAVIDSNGPATFLAQLRTLDAIASGENRAVLELVAARTYAGAVAEETTRVLAARRSAAAAADQARGRALAQVGAQVSALRALQVEQGQLSMLLHQAIASAHALAARRAAALAAARAAAAAAAAAQAARLALESARASQGATPIPIVAGPPGSAAAVAVRWAYAEIGKPYVWGAAGPDTFDCSGLTQYVYAQAGIALLHYTGDQWTEGTRVAQSALLPGDLVFFATNTSDPSTIHHVGIYVGSGQMIDAPFTGADVRFDNVFRSDYIGAVRPA